MMVMVESNEAIKTVDGRVYGSCYSEAKTGYQIAKELGRATNMVYKREDRNALFKVVGESAMGGELLLANEELMLQALEQDFSRVDIQLTAEERRMLREFFDTTWREDYGDLLDSIEEFRGPYNSFVNRLDMSLIGYIISRSLLGYFEARLQRELVDRIDLWEGSVFGEFPSSLREKLCSHPRIVYCKLFFGRVPCDEF